MFEKKDDLESETLETIKSLTTFKFQAVKQQFKKLFEDNNVNWKEKYQKISKAFDFENLPPL